MCFKNYGTLASIVLAISFCSAQPVIFSDPVAWITMRNTIMVAKAQVDTAKLEGNVLNISLKRVRDGKAQLLSSKKLTVNDFSVEFQLDDISSSLVGGYDYLQLEWSNPKATHKGVLEPFGVVVLDSLNAANSFDATKQLTISANSIDKGLLSGSKCQVGGSGIGFLWNEKELAVVVPKRSTKMNGVSVFFDGKNAKNAFLSYPDREVRIFPSNDSVATVHFVRSFVEGAVGYEEQRWYAGVSKDISADYVVVKIPLYDIGVVPFNGRKMGCMVESRDSSGTVVDVFPANAQRYIPGTWGNLLLK
jgi:hypothetical protein